MSAFAEVGVSKCTRNDVSVTWQTTSDIPLPGSEASLMVTGESASICSIGKLKTGGTEPYLGRVFGLYIVISIPKTM